MVMLYRPVRLRVRGAELSSISGSLVSHATSSESDLNDTIETSLTATDSHDSNVSQAIPSTSRASTPKLEFYGLALASRFSPHVSLRGSASLPNLILIPHEVPSFESATETRMLFPKSDLPRSSSSPYPAETQSVLNANHMDDHEGDPFSPLIAFGRTSASICHCSAVSIYPVYYAAFVFTSTSCRDSKVLITWMTATTIHPHH
jgi:hypothetical protein